MFKTREQLGPHGMLGELIAALVAKLLEAPIPEFACHEGDPGGWLSEYRASARHWHAADAMLAENLVDLGALLALDALIGNADRHARNILLAPTACAIKGDPVLRLWGIDHESCWLGRPDLAARLDARKVPLCRAQPKDMPLDLVLPRAFEAARRAETVSRAEAALASHAAVVAVGGARETAKTLCEVLLLRCRQASEIVEHYFEHLRAHSS